MRSSSDRRSAIKQVSWIVIAALVGFLCSEESGYITGETMHINGGMYMA